MIPSIPGEHEEFAYGAFLLLVVFVLILAFSILDRYLSQ